MSQHLSYKPDTYEASEARSHPPTLLGAALYLMHTPRSELATCIGIMHTPRFGLLNHIQNELLRRRDDRKHLPNWIGSPLEQALAQPVGELVEPATSAVELSFNAQTMGSGSIPAGASTTPLKLADALNKLKHRASNKVNFSICAAGNHHLIVFTLGGTGRPNSIAAFDVQGFCVACKAAAGCI